ncbi:hypothetical protein [Acinetobacter modestus]|uniref:hypothetical protein n=1 Tax=Acinetobacter modestus TaxID=1776740 RepID=UPI003019AD66
MGNSNLNQTESVPLEVAEIIEKTIFWFEGRIEILKDISESEGNVILASRLGEKKLNDEQSTAFKSGIATAIELIGKFPMSLDGLVNPINPNDL